MRIMTDVKGLLFDKDGTLFDFTRTWGGWAAGYLTQLANGDRQRAIEIANAVGFDFSDNSFKPDSIIIANTTAEIAEELARIVEGQEPQRIYDDMNRAAAEIRPVEAVPLKPLLNRFRADGRMLGVATNDTEEPTFANLESLGITELFDSILASDSGHIAKPAPDMLLAFATIVGLDPKQIIMVGDSAHDLLAGRAAGMGCVGVLTGVAEADELAPLADVVLPNIGHLPGWLAAA